MDPARPSIGQVTQTAIVIMIVCGIGQYPVLILLLALVVLMWRQ